MIKCVLIDDDDFAIESLSKLINEVKEIYSLEIVKTYTNSVTALKELKDKSNFDLLFIDYDMPGYNGVEFVQKLNKNISVVFVTSHSELSEKIINEVNIVGFLSKPTNKKDLEKILKKNNLISAKKKKTSSDRVIIPNGKKEKIFLNTKEIFHIESEGKYKNIYGLEENLKEKDTFERNPIKQNITIGFSELKQILSPFGFEQTSKTHLVNVHKILSITNTEVILKNKKKLKINDTFQSKFFECIKTFENY